MLYGAEIWGDEMDVMSKRKRITQVQRTAALRVSCAYRTVSEAAIIVIAGVIPIDLLAKEGGSSTLQSKSVEQKILIRRLEKEPWNAGKNDGKSRKKADGRHG